MKVLTIYTQCFYLYHFNENVFPKLLTEIIYPTMFSKMTLIFYIQKHNNNTISITIPNRHGIVIQFAKIKCFYIVSQTGIQKICAYQQILCRCFETKTNTGL